MEENKAEKNPIYIATHGEVVFPVDGGHPFYTYKMIKVGTSDSIKAHIDSMAITKETKEEMEKELPVLPVNETEVVFSPPGDIKLYQDGALVTEKYAPTPMTESEACLYTKSTNSDKSIKSGLITMADEIFATNEAFYNVAEQMKELDIDPQVVPTKPQVVHTEPIPGAIEIYSDEYLEGLLERQTSMLLEYDPVSFTHQLLLKNIAETTD